MIKKLTKKHQQLQRGGGDVIAQWGPVTIGDSEMICKSHCDKFCVTKKELKNEHNESGAYSSGQTEFRDCLA